MESAEFDEYGCFIATSDGEKWGIVNSRGKTVVPFICEEDYSDMLVFSEGIAAFCADEEESIYRIFSIDGEELGSFYCDFTYTPEYFSDGLLLIALSEDEFGYVDRTGTVVIPASNELDYFSSFSEGLAAVISDNGYGYIGTDGNIVIDTMYDSVSDFYNQFAVVVEDSKEKYINHAGEVIYVKP